MEEEERGQFQSCPQEGGRGRERDQKCHRHLRHRKKGRMAALSAGGYGERHLWAREEEGGMNETEIGHSRRIRPPTVRRPSPPQAFPVG